MKKIHLFRCLVISIIILVNTDCKKVVEPGTTDTVVMPPLPPPPPPPPTTPSLPPPLTPPPLPPGTIALQVGAGPDHLVYLPTDYCTLFGWISGYSTFTVEWRQISGPTSCLIENPYSLG